MIRTALFGSRTNRDVLLHEGFAAIKEKVGKLSMIVLIDL